MNNLNSLGFTHNGRKYYIFYDIFLHYNNNKITAVSPYYGEEIQLEKFYDIHNIKIIIDDHTIIGKYIPFGIKGWEPCILYDFEHPCIETFAKKEYIKLKVIAGNYNKEFTIYPKKSKNELVVATCTKNENRWMKFYLEYYTKILNVDHIYIYDNNTNKELQEELKLLVCNYRDRVSYIPWYFRWKNNKNKQIGQPQQEAHTLNKFNNKWVGFFDTDEFLFLKNKSVKDLLNSYDYKEVKAVSFENKWCMYKGSKKYEEITNPLIEFKYTKKHEHFRRLQKLFVNQSKVRFCRFHWISEYLNCKDGKIANSIDETPNYEYFFYHYFIRDFRFYEGVQGIEFGKNGVYDDEMSNFIQFKIKNNSELFN